MAVLVRAPALLNALLSVPPRAAVQLQYGHDYNQQQQYGQSPQQQYSHVRAVNDNYGEGGDLLFRAGDVITVVSQGQGDGWWEGNLNGMRGFFHSSLCEPLEQQGYAETVGTRIRGTPDGAAPPQGANADGWMMKVDEATQSPYYYNYQTGEARWQSPYQGNNLALWRLDGYNGVAGFSGVAGFAASSKYNFFQLEHGREGRPCQLPYTLGVGDEQALSRWNMIDQKLTVSRKQAIIECNSDGSLKVTSEGKGPTLLRGMQTTGGQWVGLYKGDSVILSDGDQLSLDCNDPEAAVFSCEGAMGGGGGYY